MINLYNESQKKATAKYMKENLDDIKIRVKKGERERYKQIAESDGKSLNAMVIAALEEYINNHGL